MPASLLWYDLETLGLNPLRHPCIQFGALRTDHNLRVLDTIDLLAAPSPDYLPSPESVLVHGISPLQLVGAWGKRNKVVREGAFAARVHEEVTADDTCSVGYNSVAFDNQFLHHLFFRNFLPPYQHEYQNGCSKWDLMNVLRLVSCVAPEAFILPRRADGTPSYKLEDLAQSNNIQLKAHDALEDVRALHAMACLVHQAAPALFTACYARRNKWATLRLLQGRPAGAPQPLLHFSSRFAGKYHGGSIIYPLAQDDRQTNLVHCLDLRHSPQPLLDLEVEDARARLFTKHDELATQQLAPIGIKGVRINRCPVLYPFAKEWSEATRDAIFARLGLNRATTRQHVQLAMDNRALLQEKVRAIYAETDRPATGPTPYRPAEDQLYDQFIPDDDMQHLAKRPMHTEHDALTALATVSFKDARLAAMRVRYKARNFPDQLTAAEKTAWAAHQQKIQQRDLPDLRKELQALLEQYGEGAPERILLRETQTYLNQLSPTPQA